MREFLTSRVQIVPIGITNCGKTTFINNMVGTSGLLNTSEMRETSFLWEIKFFCKKPKDKKDNFRLDVFTVTP